MTPPSQIRNPAASLILALLLPAAVLAQGQVRGTVSNGTTGHAVGGQEVRLLMPRGGMQQVATAATDSSGHFVFSADGIDPKSFYLVSADFQGASYNAPATFDSQRKST